MWRNSQIGMFFNTYVDMEILLCWQFFFLFIIHPACLNGMIKCNGRLMVIFMYFGPREGSRITRLRKVNSFNKRRGRPGDLHQHAWRRWLSSKVRGQASEPHGWRGRATKVYGEESQQLHRKGCSARICPLDSVYCTTKYWTFRTSFINRFIFTNWLHQPVPAMINSKEFA